MAATKSAKNPTSGNDTPNVVGRRCDGPVDSTTSDSVTCLQEIRSIEDGPER